MSVESHHVAPVRIHITTRKPGVILMIGFHTKIMKQVQRKQIDTPLRQNFHLSLIKMKMMKRKNVIQSNQNLKNAKIEKREIRSNKRK
jgi:hypothetical protein